MKRIIYQTDDGGVAVIAPSPEVVAALGIEFVAQKDVPHGRPYKIIDTSEIPSDRTFRGAWEVDSDALDDGVGADYGAGSDWHVIGYSDGEILLRNGITEEQTERPL